MAAALLISCEKPVDQEDPTITWAANPKFSQVELAVGLDGNIAANAPNQIESLTLTLGLGDYAVIANPYIFNDSNKGNGNKAPVFDVIDDVYVVSFLNGLGMSAGTGVRGRTVCNLDLVAILQKLIAGQPVENNTSFTIDIKLTDKTGDTVTKVAKFHYTSAPEISWTDNVLFETIDLKEFTSKNGPSKIRINAPGKIAELTVTLEYGAAPQMASYIMNRTANKGLKVDLINDAQASNSLGFPQPNVIEGKTDVTLDFGFVYGTTPDLDNSTNVFTIYVKDKNAKDASAQIKFRK